MSTPSVSEYLKTLAETARQSDDQTIERWAMDELGGYWTGSDVTEKPRAIPSYREVGLRHGSQSGKDLGSITLRHSVSELEQKLEDETVDQSGLNDEVWKSILDAIRLEAREKEIELLRSNTSQASNNTVRRTIPEAWREVSSYWRNYVVQSSIAAITVTLTFLLLDQVQSHLLIVASLGSSAFIIFTMPDNFTANPRNIIGGHIVGLVCGLAVTVAPIADFLPLAVAYGLAVGLSVLVMVVTDTEHPPAAGTALAAAVFAYSFDLVAAVVLGAILLAIARAVGRPHLRSLV